MSVIVIGLKVIAACGIIAGAFVAFYRMQREIRESGTGSSGRGGESDRQSREEIDAFIASYRSGQAVVPAAGDAPPAVGSVAIVAPDASAATWAARPAFLTGAGKLVYLLMRAGLPDHHVFANTRTVELIDLPNSNVLAQSRIDLVVCNSDLKIVAAIDVVDGDAANALEQEKRRRIDAAGIRYVRITRGNFPKAAHVRQLIYPEPVKLV